MGVVYGFYPLSRYPRLSVPFFFCLLILAFSLSRLWRHTIFILSVGASRRALKWFPYCDEAGRGAPTWDERWRTFTGLFMLLLSGGRGATEPALRGGTADRKRSS